MFLRLFVTDRWLYFGLLMAMGRNGKLYFSARDVGLMLGKKVEWAQTHGSCMLREIVSTERDDEWMIEYMALHHFLAYRLSATRCRLPTEQKLYNLLEYRHIRYCRTNTDGVRVYEECKAKEGQLFSLWMRQWRGDM